MHEDDGIVGLIGLVFIVLILIASIWRPIDKVSNLREETIVVTDKMVKNDVYLIYTKEATYEITDSWLYGRFDSSDLYGKIEVGKTYKVTVGGTRVHLLSVYPCIHEVSEAA